ncbi:DUF5666 domain-containing protein [Mycobacterium sp. E2497]|uniref:DUF5666 domain-containing protein n=1 Tax=Mycobacterium sp. E2497 TaxID=1834135 RepID=UPI000802416A|nr:DUF5666 domain-containing protein [Mycobacterium sp. E2497]OBI21340.1 hypothetical protein A5713_12530 [Mycobacterium sp. E2497]
MPTTSVNRRLARLALVAVVAVVLLGVAMCRSSDTTTGNTAKPAAAAAAPPSAVPPSAAPSAAPPPVGKDYVEGMVQSVAGDKIQLRTRSGSATVDFAPATPVFQVAPAKLPDVTPGSCVNVRATPQSSPAAGVTAQTVMITAPVDGKCPPPAGFYGTVASVSGNTIAVNGIGPGGPTTVAVTDATSYKKQTISNTQAITNGTCMGAQGTNDGRALQATTISLQTCPPMGRPHHHLHLPHLPFHL